MAAEPDLLMLRADQLAQYMSTARSYTRELLAQAIQTANAVAVTFERVAHTFDLLAESNPERAAEYRAKGKAARQRAARHRQWARTFFLPDASQDL